MVVMKKSTMSPRREIAVIGKVNMDLMIIRMRIPAIYLLRIFVVVIAVLTVIMVNSIIVKLENCYNLQVMLQLQSTDM
ncbi:hypothetical protein [Candidatus Tisiphia endosymbiont of Hybos culiciformis]|uniref:hypothetical protein n=1 Tax=Candidatus Tisiphia endosymbiont of Hybos culiciformis TaxID=3139331 RepID=UPI003CCAFF9E